MDIKFSEFSQQANPVDADEVVGLSGGDNAKFTMEDLAKYVKSKFAKSKKFSGRMSISGATVTVVNLVNDFSPVTFSYSIPFNGVVIVTSSSPVFTVGKSFLKTYAANNGGSPYFMFGSVFSTTQFRIDLILHDGTQTGTPALSDVLLEIEVFD